MRLTAIQTIYLTKEELTAAIKLYLAHIGRHELVPRMDECLEFDWTNGRYFDKERELLIDKERELLISIDGEVEG
jgi:hypothetical protein